MAIHEPVHEGPVVTNREVMADSDVLIVDKRGNAILFKGQTVNVCEEKYYKDQECDVLDHTSVFVDWRMKYRGDQEDPMKEKPEGIMMDLYRNLKVQDMKGIRMIRFRSNRRKK